MRYRLEAMRLSALILACSLGAASFAQGFIFTFDTNSEGWQRGTNTDINSLAFDGPATWAAPGLLTGNDFGGLATYFSPNMGGADREALYDGIFAFDFRSEFLQNVNVPSVYLSNGTTTINASVPIAVTPGLVTKEITLNTAGGWALQQPAPQPAKLRFVLCWAASPIWASAAKSATAVIALMLTTSAPRLCPSPAS